MQRFIFGAAGGWAIFFSLYICLVLSGNFNPTYRLGVDIAIITTIRVVGITALFALVHVGIQITLATLRPSGLSNGEKAWDIITTFLPIASFVLMFFSSWGSVAKVAWWNTLYWWVFWIVLVALLVDLFNTWRAWSIWTGEGADDGHGHDAVHH